MTNQDVFYGQWSDQADMERDFDISGKLGANIEILFACYVEGDYEGNAVVVFRDNETGKLFYIGAGHCSCYGLEGTWEPDEVEEAQLCAMEPYELTKETMEAFRKLWPHKELPQ